MLCLRERCVVTVSAMLVLELDGQYDMDILMTPFCRGIIQLPGHLKNELLSLVIKHPTCSALVLAALLSEDMDHLDLTGYSSDTASLLRACSIRCIGPSLVQLNLSALDIKSENLFILLENAHSLQELNVSYMKEWHDNHVEHIVNTCRHLHELNMNWCSNITDVSLAHIARHCASTIQSLGLAGTALSSTGVVKLVTCQRLKYLSLQACDRVDMLPHALHQVTSLDIRGLSCVHDNALHRFLSPIWTQLEKLNLGESTLTPTTLDSLIALGPCRFLERLDLSWCFQLTNTVLKNCFFHMSNLHTIKLRCLDIENNCLDAIGIHCPNLVKLNVARCRHVADEGLDMIQAKCKKLRFLDVSWSLVSNNALESLLKNCQQLETISAQGCKAVTREFLYSLSKFPHTLMLQYIDLSWIDDMLPHDINAVIERHPSIQIRGYFGELYQQK